MTTTQQAITSALGEILAVPDIEADDNFFALGGDSLSAVELMERVEAELGIEFPLQTLFSSGRIGDVVEECEGRVAARA